MNQPKPKDTLAGQKCPLCKKGQFELIQIDHREECPDSPAVVVSGVWVDQCNHCNEVVYPGETTRFIEQLVSEQSDLLSPHELERLREELGLDQTEIGEVLGLGSKSYHRWEKGTQFPSRSMCYYIRVVAEFPEAYAWLRQRGWKQKNRLHAIDATQNRTHAFPALARLESQKGVESGRLQSGDNVNYPKAFSRIRF
ncbi:MAG: type II toxin-antitoxin system MqsA family antitoxin [Methylacidiphilales bacterium]|nr:type II toxin-antitoxin system MqsA family antitoxin [Candidatus Methylacidiphilales bacterium]